jgi:hypothetical protein
MKIIIDIDVQNCQIRAAKPVIGIAMPNDDVGKTIFFSTMPGARLNNRVYGHLKGRGLQKAKRIMDKHGGINVNGEYGSIEIEDGDFIPNQPIRREEE